MVWAYKFIQNENIVWHFCDCIDKNQIKIRLTEWYNVQTKFYSMMNSFTFYVVTMRNRYTISFNNLSRR